MLVEMRNGVHENKLLSNTDLVDGEIIMFSLLVKNEAPLEGAIEVNSGDD